MAVPMKTTNGNRKLILDVDTGIDDALALAYLASFNNIEILGVIGTYGNVAADTAVYNTAYVLERLGFRNVPVLRGSTRPSWAASFIPDAGCAQFHGTDGLGGFGPAVGSPALLACPILVKRTSGSPIRHPMCPILQNRTFRAPRTPSMRPIRVNRTFPVPSALLMCPIQENRTLE